jgi:putative ABC transport system ATP-binding protein
MVDGVRLDGLSETALTLLRRQRIGFAFQSFNLVPFLDAQHNVALPLLLAGRRPSKADAMATLAAVGLADRARHRPAELSGGQQQRVALARALMAKPAVLFADEPTGNLDSTTGRQMLTLLRDAVDLHGQTLVMVTMIRSRRRTPTAWCSYVTAVSPGNFPIRHLRRSRRG